MPGREPAGGVKDAPANCPDLTRGTVSRAFKSAAAFGKRRAGSLARARSRSACKTGGVSCRNCAISGNGLVLCITPVSAEVRPTNGTRPVIISNRTRANWAVLNTLRSHIARVKIGNVIYILPRRKAKLAKQCALPNIIDLHAVCHPNDIYCHQLRP